MDALTIQTISEGFTKALVFAKTLFDFAKSVKNAQAQLAYSELQKELAELNSKFSDLMNENTDLKDQLRKARTKESDMEFRDGLYFKPGDADPFCPSCWGASKTETRLVPAPAMIARRFGKFQCPVCNKPFGGTSR